VTSCPVDEEGNHPISLSKIFKDFMKKILEKVISSQKYTAS
jgi:hypothetical protein